jgi:hypothetical protein
MTIQEAKLIIKKSGAKLIESNTPGYDPHFGGNDLQDAWNEFATMITDDQLFIDHLLQAWNEDSMDEFVTYVAGVELA